jgi:hypothetical protein
VRLAVVLETPTLAPIDVDRMVDAVQVQLATHYADMWEAVGPVIRRYDTLAAVPSDWSVIAILESADEAGVLGYHATTPDGRPYGRVFVAPVLSNGGTVLDSPNSVSVTLSHEAIEADIDPYCNFWADMPDARNEDAIEGCDRVEGDAYAIGNVYVSNFLGPRAFGNGPGPYDYMGVLKQPWDVRENGYAIRRYGGQTGSITTTFGRTYPGWKMATKEHPASRTARRMLVERITTIPP